MAEPKAGDVLDDPRYAFELPEGLIARYPLECRDESRLLGVDPSRGAVSDLGRFKDLPEFLRPGDLLVVNDTRVFPARLRARRATGGAVEIVLLAGSGPVVPALVRPLTKLRTGEELRVGEAVVVIGERLPDGPVLVSFPGSDALQVAEAWGEAPIPPYLKRRAEPGDRARYQTIFAKERGSAAAPTASLHFTPEVLAHLDERGVERAELTLHVGYGTFAPVQAGQERLHAEPYRLPAELPGRMADARARGGRIVAAGTTVVRALETWAATGRLEGETEIFIRPGHRFLAVDALLTNFHLPGSSLLVLVHAFAGDLVFDAYRHALEHGYRFYSYGDAMLVTGRGAA